MRQKVSALGIGIFSVLIVLFFSLGFEADTDVSLNDLEENEYSAVPTTIPITVTSNTISPSIQKLTSDTQTVSATTSEYNYQGTGFVFPLLQKSYGIGTSVTTLNYDDWDLGTTAEFCHNPAVDESGGTYDGNVYMNSCTTSQIFRFNPATEVLTTWTSPLVGGNSILVNGTGFVFFNSQNNIARLNPFTDEITVWNNLAADYTWTVAIDPSTNDIYFGNAATTSRIYSLNPETNLLKTWDVESICTHVAFSFHSMVWDDIGKKAYASQLEVPELCELNPSNNLVTLYDTGLDFGRSWFIGIDPTNAGHVYFPAEGSSTASAKILRIDTVTPQATVWTLTGDWNARGIDVDSAGVVWMPTATTQAVASNLGILRLIPSTNIITEWSFEHGLATHSSLFPMANGTLWQLTDTGNANDEHIVRFNE